jgi:hypothetical protein
MAEELLGNAATVVESPHHTNETNSLSDAPDSIIHRPLLPDNSEEASKDGGISKTMELEIDRLLQERKVSHFQDMGVAPSFVLRVPENISREQYFEMLNTLNQKNVLATAASEGQYIMGIVLTKDHLDLLRSLGGDLVFALPDEESGRQTFAALDDHFNRNGAPYWPLIGNSGLVAAARQAFSQDDNQKAQYDVRRHAVKFTRDLGTSDKPHKVGATMGAKGQLLGIYDLERVDFNKVHAPTRQLVEHIDFEQTQQEFIEHGMAFKIDVNGFSDLFKTELTDQQITEKIYQYNQFFDLVCKVMHELGNEILIGEHISDSIMIYVRGDISKAIKDLSNVIESAYGLEDPKNRPLFDFQTKTVGLEMENTTLTTVGGIVRYSDNPLDEEQFKKLEDQHKREDMKSWDIVTSRDEEYIPERMAFKFATPLPKNLTIPTEKSNALSEDEQKAQQKVLAALKKFI